MKKKWIVVIAAGTVVFLMIFIWNSVLAKRNPLCASVEEDICWQDGKFYIYGEEDYLRFVGYLNRAREEEPDNEAGTAIDAVLLKDIDLKEAKVHAYLKRNPYIKQGILNYNGNFDGRGHTIIWYENGGNGMFICLERGAVVKNLTFRAESLVWDMDEYGVGMLCMINYGTIVDCRTKGRIEGTACYVGGNLGY